MKWNELDRFVQIMFAILGVICATVIGLITWAIYTEVTEPKSGSITELEYHSEHTTVQCSSTGRTTTCVPITHPECWSVVYSNNGKTGNDCVSHKTWEGLEIGDWYSQD